MAPRAVSCVAALAACGLYSSLAPRTFLAPPAPRGSPGDALQQLGGRPVTLQAAPSSRGVGATGEMKPFALTALVAGMLVAMRSTRRRSGTALRVTKEDILELTEEQVPSFWKRKISTGASRRNALAMAIRKKLETTFFIVGINYHGLTTQEYFEMRSMFPSNLKVCVLKNSLLDVACRGTPWEEFGSSMKGPNLYIFADEDKDIKPALKCVNDIAKKFNMKDRIAKLNENNPYEFETKMIHGACIRDEWNFIEGKDVPKLEQFPTKTELIGRIAGGIQKVTQKIAVGVKQVPQKLAVGTKKVVEKMEEDGKDSVADVVA